jgi:hypothetical protein
MLRARRRADESDSRPATMREGVIPAVAGDVPFREPVHPENLSVRHHGAEESISIGDEEGAQR